MTVSSSGLFGWFMGRGLEILQRCQDSKAPDQAKNIKLRLTVCEIHQNTCISKCIISLTEMHMIPLEASESVCLTSACLTILGLFAGAIG